MRQILSRVFYFGPLIFAFGFMVPLILQVINYFEWQPPLGVEPLYFALGLGGILGLVAQIRGRWI